MKTVGAPLPFPSVRRPAKRATTRARADEAHLLRRADPDGAGSGASAMKNRREVIGGAAAIAASAVLPVYLVTLPDTASGSPLGWWHQVEEDAPDRALAKRALAREAAEIQAALDGCICCWDRAEFVSFLDAWKPGCRCCWLSTDCRAQGTSACASPSPAPGSPRLRCARRFPFYSPSIVRSNSSSIVSALAKSSART
jgi:hypothetical protein